MYRTFGTVIATSAATRDYFYSSLDKMENFEDISEPRHTHLDR